MKLAIYSAATKGYQYALAAQARRVILNLRSYKKPVEVRVILVTNDVDVVKDALAVYESFLPASNIVVLADSRYGLGLENYKVDAQLLIAQMRTAATMEAVTWGADYCWSLDSDVLPPANALRCMVNMLDFDDGYYGVAFCPYPSQGGGAFLGGRGSVRNQIYPDFYEEEKDVPPELLAERDELLKELSDDKTSLELRKSLHDKLSSKEKAIRELPPRSNVFACNAIQWRQRGWFDSAYPAIGKGAIVPVDWTGCGCTLMNSAALVLCDWSGYEGKGTEDLYINYNRWQANGIRICAIPHCPCDHVVRSRDDKSRLVHLVSYHEHDGERVGHLRQRAAPWYEHCPGEHATAANTGVLFHSPKQPEAEPVLTPDTPPETLIP